MATEFLQSNFDEQPLQCSKCRWQGTGHDAVIIDFYGVSINKEVHCPQCDGRLGVVRKDKNDPPGESATDLSFQIG